MVIRHLHSPRLTTGAAGDRSRDGLTEGRSFARRARDLGFSFSRDLSINPDPFRTGAHATVVATVIVAWVLLGRRLREHHETLREPFWVLQAALLGLVGLILAFGLLAIEVFGAAAALGLLGLHLSVLGRGLWPMVVV